MDRKGWGKDGSWRPEERHSGVCPRNETGFLVGPKALEAITASSSSRDTKNRTLEVPKTRSPAQPGSQVRIGPGMLGTKLLGPHAPREVKTFPLFRAHHRRQHLLQLEQRLLTPVFSLRTVIPSRKL